MNGCLYNRLAASSIAKAVGAPQSPDWKYYVVWKSEPVHMVAHVPPLSEVHWNQAPLRAQSHSAERTDTVEWPRFSFFLSSMTGNQQSRHHFLRNGVHRFIIATLLCTSTCYHAIKRQRISSYACQWWGGPLGQNEALIALLSVQTHLLIWGESDASLAGQHTHAGGLV